MALYLALLCSSYSNAQVDPTTGNLINYGSTPTDTTSKWNNGVYVNQLCFQAGQPGNCGPNPSIRPDGAINFSYGTTDLNQIVNINRALSAGGNGVQLSGFNFGFTAKNGNGWDDGRQDYLAAYVKLYGNSGLMANYDYSAQTNRKYNWTNFNFSETFANPIAASNYTNAQVGFVGRDNNYWAGNYGPEIINVSFSLKYRVDPCALNPAYSPSCSGFNTVTTSNNILPQPDTWGTSMNQIVAINTALKNGGIGATIHGFNYDFDYTLGQSWSGCTATNQDGSCSWYMNIPAHASVTAQLTNSNNQSIYSRNYSLTGDGTSGSVSGQYLLPTSLSQTSLGNVRLYGSTSGTGSSIGNFSASLIYTADPCVSNPLYSTLCSGYAVAFAKNMLLGSTVASASGAIVSSGGNTMSSPTGQVEQSQGNTQPDQTQPQQQTQQAQQTQQQASPSPQQDSNQNPAVAQDNPAQPGPQQAGPASTSPQPAGGPPQTATTSATPTSAGPSQAGPQQGGGAGPSKLAMSVLKTAQAKEQATQAAAVQQAAKAFESSQASSQSSSNLAITMNQDMSANSATAAANFASQSTQASQQTATQSVQQQTQQAVTQTQQTNKTGPQVQQQQQQDTQQVQVQSSGQVQVQAPQQQDTQQAQVQTSTSVVKLLPPQQQEQVQSQSSMSAGMILPIQNTYTAPQQQQQDTQSTQSAMLKPPVQAVIETPTQASSGTGITLVRNPFAYNPLLSFSSANISMPAQQPTYQPKLDTREAEAEVPQFQMASFGGAGRAGNPLSDLMQQRFELMQNNIAAPASAVNKNVQPNELAGRVDITSMATTPAGFNAYSFVLKDSAFYEPKEVYKNQRTVDNERVLRGLTRGSDSLHQQMIDQQYKLGN